MITAKDRQFIRCDLVERDAALRIALRVQLFSGGGDGIDVDPRKIHYSQSFLLLDRMERIKESIRTEGLHNPAPCVKVGEDFYLVDGHHRTAAQIALGYKTIKVRAVEVSPEEWEAEIQRLKEK